MYTTRAFAKVNLDLRVTATRPDGYHELETIFQTIALADVLTLMPDAGPFRLTSDMPGLPLGADNLAVQGAVAVARELGRDLEGWRLHLEKRVPAEAGLGGGSADAVAAARLVLAAFGARWTADRLAMLLAPLGSDVAFFVAGGTALGRGRGDELTPLADLPDHAVLLVRPGIGVSTREAYGWFDAGPAPAPAAPQALPADAAAWPVFFETCRNDLQPAVVARHPEIGDGVRRLVSARSRLTLMSGSGSALFGLFASDADLAPIAAGWPPDWQVWPTRTLGRAAYRAETGVQGPSGVHHPLFDSTAVV